MQKRRIWNYEKRNKKTIVEFKDVVRTYGEGEALQYAVNHVNFTIEEGKFVVILGQSGAGKLTVLNMLGGMDQPTEGEVIIEEYGCCWWGRLASGQAVYMDSVIQKIAGE